MADKIKTDETLPDVSAADVKAAQLEGVKNVITESAEARFKATDGNLQNEVEPGIVPTYDVFHLQDKLEMDPDAITAWMNGKSDEAFVPSQGQVAGLLEVERSGKNRTDVVAVLMKRLGIKSPYEVTDAGPNYTNDVSRNILKR